MTWLLTVVCLIGTVFNVKRLRLCFAIWAIGNIGWLIYDIAIGLYSRAMLDFVQLCFSVWGFFEWRKPR